MREDRGQITHKEGKKYRKLERGNDDAIGRMCTDRSWPFETEILNIKLVPART
jgi:hypothetical protein